MSTLLGTVSVTLAYNRQDDQWLANVKALHAVVSQHDWRQASTDGAVKSVPGDTADPTSVPTRSVRGSMRKRVCGHAGECEAVAECVDDCEVVALGLKVGVVLYERERVRVCDGVTLGDDVCVSVALPLDDTDAVTLTDAVVLPVPVPEALPDCDGDCVDVCERVPDCDAVAVPVVAVGDRVELGVFVLVRVYEGVCERLCRLADAVGVIVDVAVIVGVVVDVAVVEGVVLCDDVPVPEDVTVGSGVPPRSGTILQGGGTEWGRSST